MVERPVNGLCHKLFNLNQLKRRQLQLNTSHRRPAHKNDRLQATQGYNQYTGLAKVFIDVVVCHHKVPKSNITDWSSLFISKFWSSLYYFLEIKKKLFTAFYFQINGQTKRQNSTIDAYLRVFVNWEQDYWARLLLMAEFAYKNAKNASTGHTPFELNCSYYLRVFFEEDVDLCSRSCFTNNLTEELRELMEIYCQNLLRA